MNQAPATTVSAATAATTPAAGSAADPGWRSTWVGRHRIGVFLLLAFALSGWAWPLALLNPESSAQVSFGPIIAALLVAAVAGGRGQAVRLLRAVVRWRVPWSRYVIAVAGPFLVTAVVAVLAGSFAVIIPVPVSEAFGWFQEEPAPADLLAVVLSRATLAYRRRPRPSQAERDTLSSSTSAGAVSSG